MDHSENDTRFYVYVHKDSCGNVRYVSSGSGQRFRSLTDRSPEHLEIWKQLDKVILVSEMSRTTARKYEELLIKKLFPTGLLFNKQITVPNPRKVLYKKLSEYLKYDETSPTFLTWIKQPTTSAGVPLGIIKIGQQAGSYARSAGYSSVVFFGETLKAHRVVYALCHKVDVPFNLVIDHIDGNRSNNNINNLRLVTFTENNRNIAISKTNKTGVPGVSWCNTKSGGYWVAYCTINLKRRTRNFNPRTLYPELPEEEAKEKAFKDAVDYRLELESLLLR